MLPYETDPGLVHLGNEELQHHDALTTLEQEIRSSLHSLQQSLPNAQLASIDRQVQERLASIRSHIRDLELLAEEQDTEEQARAVEGYLHVHKAEYESLRAAITHAKLQAKKNQDLLFAQQRKELFAGASIAVLQRQYQKESDLLAGAQDITDSLRRSRQVLAQQLEHTAGNLQALGQSNATLGKAKDELSGQKELFKQSNQRLSTLKQQGSNDRKLLWMGLTFFMLVSAYILYKRVPTVIKAPINSSFRMAGKGAWLASTHAYRLLNQAVAGARSKTSTAKPVADDPFLAPWPSGADEFMSASSAHPGFNGPAAQHGQHGHPADILHHDAAHHHVRAQTPGPSPTSQHPAPTSKTTHAGAPPGQAHQPPSIPTTPEIPGVLKKPEIPDLEAGAFIAKEDASGIVWERVVETGASAAMDAASSLVSSDHAAASAPMPYYMAEPHHAPLPSEIMPVEPQHEQVQASQQHDGHYHQRHGDQQHQVHDSHRSHDPHNLLQHQPHQHQHQHQHQRQQQPQERPYQEHKLKDHGPEADKLLPQHASDSPDKVSMPLSASSPNLTRMETFDQATGLQLIPDMAAVHGHDAADGGAAPSAAHVPAAGPLLDLPYEAYNASGVQPLDASAGSRGAAAAATAAGPTAGTTSRDDGGQSATQHTNMTDDSTLTPTARQGILQPHAVGNLHSNDSSATSGKDESRDATRSMQDGAGSGRPPSIVAGVETKAAAPTAGAAPSELTGGGLKAAASIGDGTNADITDVDADGVEDVDLGVVGAGAAASDVVGAEGGYGVGADEPDKADDEDEVEDDYVDDAPVSWKAEAGQQGAAVAAQSAVHADDAGAGSYVNAAEAAASAHSSQPGSGAAMTTPDSGIVSSPDTHEDSLAIEGLPRIQPSTAPAVNKQSKADLKHSIVDTALPGSSSGSSENFSQSTIPVQDSSSMLFKDSSTDVSDGPANDTAASANGLFDDSTLISALANDSITLEAPIDASHITSTDADPHPAAGNVTSSILADDLGSTGSRAAEDKAGPLQELMQQLIDVGTADAPSSVHNGHGSVAGGQRSAADPPQVVIPELRARAGRQDVFPTAPLLRRSGFGAGSMSAAAVQGGADVDGENESLAAAEADQAAHLAELRAALEQQLQQQQTDDTHAEPQLDVRPLRSSSKDDVVVPQEQLSLVIGARSEATNKQMSSYDGNDTDYDVDYDEGNDGHSAGDSVHRDSDRHPEAGSSRAVNVESQAGGSSDVASNQHGSDKGSGHVGDDDDDYDDDL